ncbi:ZPR1 zinc finger domain-containing protein [Candidatus Woesearchaeota archaeon]|jgi:zinc finger protein|nr:ZPR1 zinc finger domain-containing protein [Candidatus Woesearchaeota archaeon]MBT5215692.1 ZPR1 zinc finger domain-containing protein [Candidatus Woesearchaeota archaeon]MBT6401987.1 ZPR1 zinc finger domain-containing protein [Candidatus Woesearchaeota archaeon]
MEEMKGQQCIFCGKKTLTLMQDELDIPYFGKVLVFSMKCENVDCNYVKSDVEAVGIKEPCKVTFEVKDKKDLNVRVIRSSTSHIKIPAIKLDLRPGPAAEGYVSNIEGVIERYKKVLEGRRDTTDDSSERKSLKNLLKKIWKVQCGDIPIKIVIEDPTGNSSIISERAVIEKLKVKR